jgi:hypothetical protein
LFPAKVLDLVNRSRDQADALNDRVLASDSLSDPSIRKIRAVCHTAGSLAAAMRPPGAGNG